MDIVIVNWNTAEYLVTCLQSIADTQARTPADKVIVVDNASSDGSQEAAGRYAPILPLIFVQNEANRGFAAACNQGAALGAAPLILFLNPDVRLNADCLAVPS